MALFVYVSTLVRLKGVPNTSNLFKGYAGRTVALYDVGDDAAYSIQRILYGKSWKILMSKFSPIGVIDAANNGSWFHADRFWGE